MSGACSFKERCGSCTWSEIPYAQQLERKLNEINACFAAQHLELECTKIAASPVLEHYRNRMDFAIDFEGRFGLREKGKWWRVIDGHTCFLADRAIEDLFSKVRQWIPRSGLSFFDRKRHHGLLRYALIRASTIGQRMLMIVSSAPQSASEELQIEAALRDLAQALPGTTLVWGINSSLSDTSFADRTLTISGAGFIEEQVLDWRYRISPNSFFQTNSRAAALLLETVLQFAEQNELGRCLDLFCGAGFFTIPLAATTGQAHGVELNADGIRDAGINAELNRSRADFELLKSEDFDLNALRPHTVLVDPPRAGLHQDLLSRLCANPVASLIYVSCNYRRFAEELVQLKQAYELVDLKAIDLFPHTPHVEVVSLLRRKI